MHRFFTAPENFTGEQVVITGSDVNHMKNVLRLQVGDQVQVNDSQGKTYLCRVFSYDEENGEAKALLEIDSILDKDTELPVKIVLFQGLPKADKMELIIQKAVELGVQEIVPVATKRAVVKLDDKKAAKKTDRWQSIAVSAAKQSDRNRIPEVVSVMSFPEALTYAQSLDIVLIPYENWEDVKTSKALVADIKQGQSVGVFIGPEGGFEAEEVEKARQNGAMPLSLGKRILRTETAAIAILSILMYHLEG